MSAIKKIDTFSCIIYWNTKTLATKAGVEEVQEKGEEATADSGKYEVVDVVGDSISVWIIFKCTQNIKSNQSKQI